jgi:hypothetical protein
VSGRVVRIIVLTATLTRRARTHRCLSIHAHCQQRCLSSNSPVPRFFMARSSFLSLTTFAATLSGVILHLKMRSNAAKSTSLEESKGGASGLHAFHARSFHHASQIVP